MSVLAHLLEFLLYAIGQWGSGVAAGYFVVDNIGDPAKDDELLQALGVALVAMIPGTASFWMPALQEEKRDTQSALLTAGTLMIAGGTIGWRIAKFVNAPGGKAKK